MVASATFAEFLREQLAPLGRITVRRMFGKTGVFCDGVMFGMVTENTLYFRVDDQNRVTFKEAEAFPPLNYQKKGSTIDLSFWRVPERLFDEPDELVTWAQAALAAAGRGEARTDGAKAKIEASANVTAGALQARSPDGTNGSGECARNCARVVMTGSAQSGTASMGGDDADWAPLQPGYGWPAAARTVHKKVSASR